MTRKTKKNIQIKCLEIFSILFAVYFWNFQIYYSKKALKYSETFFYLIKAKLIKLD